MREDAALDRQRRPHCICAALDTVAFRSVLISISISVVFVSR
jgi:hypothetical protein